MVHMCCLIAPADIHPGVTLAAVQAQLDLEHNHNNGDVLFTSLQNKGLKDHMFSTFTDKWIERLSCRYNP